MIISASFSTIRARPADVDNESNTKTFLFGSTAITSSAARRAELNVPLSFALRVTIKTCGVFDARIVSANVSTDGQADFGAFLFSFMRAMSAGTSLPSWSW